MNILILSAGTRNKVVRAFKEALKGDGLVVATDCSNLAPAVYDADKFYLVPRINAPGYIDIILDICKKEKIAGVFSLIDPELSLLAKEKERFLQIGTLPIVSPYELTQKCFNKLDFFKLMLEYGMKTGRCFADMENFFKAKERGEISYPVFVKPICGSASININKVQSDDEIRVLYKLYDDIMVQEYMPFEEYGADAYIDILSGKCVSIFVKKKIKMRAGETDKSVSVIMPKLFDEIKAFTEKAGFVGMIDIDIFHDIKTDTFYFSEVNPRFGGGYPHAYACGVNMPYLLINNLKGNENTPDIGNYKEGIVMMKYNDVLIKDFSGAEIVE